MMGAEEFARLPSCVKPLNYQLELTPYLDNFTFNGRVNILSQVVQPTSYIMMNCADIDVQKATFSHKSGVSLEPSSIQYNQENETLTLSFSEEIQTGTGTLSMDYAGILNDKMRGFYRSKYKKDGEEKYAATTHFEPTNARRCLPCWDEPALRATFEVTLVVPAHLTALSNECCVEHHVDEKDSTKIVYKFAKTPIMSTYLLAVVVGEFDYVEAKSSYNVLTRVYTPVGKASHGKHALDIAVKAIDFYADYFKTPYPLRKLDLIAIDDFPIGAMENWGLVTYREPALLVEETSSSLLTRQYIAIVVCHELAHQWFGNLVTLDWWTHLWLKEGFASFMEYLATDHCHPSYQVWTQFINDDLIRALDLDSLENSHPIEVPVGHPDEVKEIFDIISYNKGASIIRMLNYWLGNTNFRTGLRNYLQKYEYKSTVTEDLWSELEKVNNDPVQKVMSTWTKQMGFPVINVNVISSNSNSITLQITQKKYRANALQDDVSDALWMVPITISTSTGGDEHQKYLLQSKTAQVTVNQVTSDGWIKLNPDFTGFYRVNYSKELLDKLLKSVNQLPTIDRLNIVNDVFAMASAGVSSFVDYFRALEAFENEMDYPVWKDICSKLTDLKYMIWNDEKTSSMFEKFTGNLTKGLTEKLGWEPQKNESHLTSLLRVLALSFCNDKKITEKCKTMVLNHLNGSELLRPDLRVVIYRKYLAAGDVKECRDILKLHENADSQEEENRIHSSLGSVKSEAAFNLVLDFVMSDKIRDHERPFLMRSLANTHQYGREKCWEFVKNNWKFWNDKYAGSHLLGRLIQYTTENFATKEKSEDVKNFFVQNPAPGAERSLKQSIEKIDQKTLWWERNGEGITKWLGEKYQ